MHNPFAEFYSAQSMAGKNQKPAWLIAAKPQLCHIDRKKAIWWWKGWFGIFEMYGNYCKGDDVFF